MKIIRTASFQQAELNQSPASLPTMASPDVASGIPAPMDTPRPAKPPQSKVDFEVHTPADINELQAVIADAAAGNMKGHSENPFGDSSSNLIRYDIDFDFTVRVIEPMTTDDLPYSLHGNASDYNGESIPWEAIREFTNDTQLAKYSVGSTY